MKIATLILISLGVGSFLGVYAHALWKRWLRRRDQKVTTQIERQVVRARLPDVPTDEMLEELSRRDLNEQRFKVENW